MLLSGKNFFVAKSTLCNSVDWGLLDNIEVGAEPATGRGLMALPVAEKEKTRRKRKMEEKTGIRRKRPRCDVKQLERERE